MAGRYGVDQLSVALLVFSVLLTAAARVAGLPLLIYISYLPLALCIYRMLSRDINRRRMENYKFSMLVSPVYSWLRKMQMRVAQRKTHKFFTCPVCKAHLRLPRGKGKVIITCPKCKTEFRAKS